MEYFLSFKMKTVAVGIIRKDGNFLIAKRRLDSSGGGKWEFPGGKVEDGETITACLRRELKEELGIDVEVGKFFAESLCEYYQGKFKLVAHEVDSFSGEIKALEHDEFCWVTPREMDRFKFVEGDMLFVAKLKKMVSEA